MDDKNHESISLQTEPSASTADDEDDVIGLSSGRNAVHFDRIQRDRVGPSQCAVSATSVPISITGRPVSAVASCSLPLRQQQAAAAAAAVDGSDIDPLLYYVSHFSIIDIILSSSSSRRRALVLCLLGKCVTVRRFIAV